MLNVILLHSNRPSIGKSTFAEYLLKGLDSGQYMSFATPIKEIAYDMYCSTHNLKNSSTTWPIAYSDFKQDMKDLLLAESACTPRDITIDVSELIQKIYGKDVWSIIAYQSCIRFNKELNNNTFIFDDWRRPVESSHLGSKEDINLIKVFITKQERRSTKRLSSTSESYEGLIKPEDCDIVFEFNDDWSNSDQLKGLILNAIV